VQLFEALIFEFFEYSSHPCSLATCLYFLPLVPFACTPSFSPFDEFGVFSQAIRKSVYPVTPSPFIFAILAAAFLF